MEISVHPKHSFTGLPEIWYGRPPLICSSAFQFLSKLNKTQRTMLVILCTTLWSTIFPACYATGQHFANWVLWNAGTPWWVLKIALQSSNSEIFSINTVINIKAVLDPTNHISQDRLSLPTTVIKNLFLIVAVFIQAYIYQILKSNPLLC